MTHLLIATGESVLRLQDPMGSPRSTRLFSGARAASLALGSGIVLTGTHGGGVWRSLDGGENWQDMLLPQSDVFSVAVSPADGSIYAGCEPSMLFRSVDGETSWEELAALRALPSAPSWSFPPRPWTSHVRWIAPHPSDPAHLLVGVELGGLMYSDDGGLSWADHRPGAQPDVHALAWHPSGERAYEAGGGGAAWSFDGGWTWSPADDGRDRHYCWALACDPDVPDRWYISANPGPRQAHGRRGNADARMYRWQADGPWEALGGGLPDPLPSMPYALAAAGEEVYAGLADGTLYGSGDRGDTWREIRPAGERPSAVLALAIVA